MAFWSWNSVTEMSDEILCHLTWKNKSNEKIWTRDSLTRHMTKYNTENLELSRWHFFSSLAAPCYHNDNPGATRDDKATDRFKSISVKMLYLTSYWDQSLHDTFYGKIFSQMRWKTYKHQRWRRFYHYSGHLGVSNHRQLECSTTWSGW